MKKSKKIGTFRIIIILILCMAILALVSLIIIHGDKFSLSNLLHGFKDNYAPEFYYDNAADGAFSSISGGLCVLTNTELTVFDRSGEENISRFVTFSSPALQSAGDYGVAYDIGGNDILFFSSSEVVKELETESSIVSATVSSSGYFAVCTEETGWGGSVTVYNPRGSAIYKWYSGSDRVLSASIRGKQDLLVLSVGQDGSSLVRLSLDSEDEQARYTCAGLIYDARFTSSGVAAITTSSVLFLSDTLKEQQEYDLSDRYLAFYDFSGTYSVLVTGESQLSSQRTISILGSDGNELYTTPSNGVILDISANGKYLAVLYADSAEVFNSDLSSYAVYDQASGYDAVMVRSDGTIIAAGAYSAGSFSPADKP